MTKFGSAGVILARGAAVGAAGGLVAPGSDTFTNVAQVASISGPGNTKADIEVTDLSSAAKEFISDLPDSGSLEMTIQYDSLETTHQDLQADSAAPQRARNWRITLPDNINLTATTIDFVGEVTSFTWSFETASVITADLTVKVSGAATVTART